MALLVEDGTGVEGADSYVTFNSAELYFETRLHSEDWIDETDDDKKEAALRSATFWLDTRVAWYGEPVNLDPAYLRWPRSGVTTTEGFEFPSDEIPSFLKKATYELAIHLLRQDRTVASDTRGLDEVQVDVIRLKFNPEASEGSYNEMFPSTVTSIIKPYGRVTSGTSVKRLVRT